MCQIYRSWDKRRSSYFGQSFRFHNYLSANQQKSREADAQRSGNHFTFTILDVSIISSILFAKSLRPRITCDSQKLKRCVPPNPFNVKQPVLLVPVRKSQPNPSLSVWCTPGTVSVSFSSRRYFHPQYPSIQKQNLKLKTLNLLLLSTSTNLPTASRASRTYRLLRIRRCILIANVLGFFVSAMGRFDGSTLWFWRTDFRGYFSCGEVLRVCGAYGLVSWEHERPILLYGEDGAEKVGITAEAWCKELSWEAQEIIETFIIDFVNWGWYRDQGICEFQTWWCLQDMIDILMVTFCNLNVCKDASTK